MFTGLIETTGRVERVEPTPRGQRMRLSTPLAAELGAGDSLSVNGVCLTVTTHDVHGVDLDVSPETLRVTTLSTFAPGRVVNLERPLRADGRLGGHFVLGHVDAVGIISAIKPDGDCYWLDVDFPLALSPYFIAKGSVAVDGISLTVATLGAHQFGVQIVPFTWTHTALHGARTGDRVNLEVDVIGKYVARQLEFKPDLALAPEGARDHS